MQHLLEYIRLHLFLLLSLLVGVWDKRRTSLTSNDFLSGIHRDSPLSNRCATCLGPAFSPCFLHISS
jgi:hypothetical protein